MRLYSVCDIVEEKAQKLARDFGAQKIYTDYREMLKDPALDVVSICTPSGMHGEMAIEAARAGKHILCEKPLEITKEKLDEMISEVEKSGVKMGCVFQRRVQPFISKVKKALEENLFGKVVLAEAYMKDFRSEKYYESAGWRGTWELDGGGALMNQSIHGIDLLSWLMGGTAGISAICRTQRHKIEVEDTAVAIARFNNGAVGVIEGTTSVYPPQPFRIEIHCTEGSIVFDGSCILLWGTQPYESSSQKETDDKENNVSVLKALSHTPLVRDLAEAIETGREPLIPPGEGRKAVDIILAIYESSRTGKEVILR